MCAQRFSHALKIYFLSVDSQMARFIYFVNLQVHRDGKESDWSCTSREPADPGEGGSVAGDGVSGLLEPLLYR